MVDMHFNNRELFSLVDAVAKAEPQDIAKRLDELLDPDNCTLSVVCGEEG